MERTELIEKIRGKVQNAFEDYKEKVVCYEQEDYCDEMALMYSFRKYLQYIQTETNELSLTDDELKVFVDNIERFIDDFLDIYWNSDLGNSYYDIKKVLDELLEEYKEGRYDYE